MNTTDVIERLSELVEAEKTVSQLIVNPENADFYRENLKLKIRTRATIAALGEILETKCANAEDTRSIKTTANDASTRSFTKSSDTGNRNIESASTNRVTPEIITPETAKRFSKVKRLVERIKIKLNPPFKQFAKAAEQRSRATKREWSWK
jgi:hypothetical protein